MWGRKKRGQPFTINTRHHEAVTILELVGKASKQTTGGLLRSSVEALMKEGRNLVLLDLRRVSFTDDWSIAELVVAWKRIVKAGGMLKLMIPPTGRTHDLFQGIPLLPMLDVFVDKEVALKSF